ncbi:hypothetical protein HPP92_020147 [Vanilla planifolia]|uniref:Uncharacterized protein n=1 Tax=Vanilla planifolia TaxID=51239 RepID=A0A835ULL6_VANPL|nr:hypothetical protein HPP92_020147 [Vanilla planifolia]
MFPNWVSSEERIHRKTPKLRCILKLNLRVLPALLEAIEAISSTDAEEDTSSVEGDQIFCWRSSSKEAIGAADGSWLMKPEWQEQQQKGTVSLVFTELLHTPKEANKIGDRGRLRRHGI